MLKHENIIKQLNTSQKIRMLCDISVLAEKEYKVLGIPRVNVGYMETACGEKYPSLYMMANSWDTALVGSVADEMAKEMAAKDTGLVVTTGAKIKLTPYSYALSEDVKLSVAMSSAYLGAIKSKGMSSCVRGFSLTEDEAEWMDAQPDARVLCDYVVAPFMKLRHEAGFSAAAVSTALRKENYGGVNKRFSEIASSVSAFEGTFPVCEKAGVKDTVACVAEGIICFTGDSLALESALNRYRQLQKSVANGLFPDGELAAALLDHTAVSPEMIDAAADRLVDFALSCRREKTLVSPSGVDTNELAASAARESAVLLKNQGKVLPLNKKDKFCIIGDTAVSAPHASFAEELRAMLEERGYTYVGMERGYELSLDRSEELLPPALELAEKADVVLLFLGIDERRERRIHKSHKLSVPANQQLLLDRLGAMGKKIVTVVSGDHAADIVMTEKTQALLLAVINTGASARALAEILSGEYSPCGRLSKSLYIDTDNVFRDQLVCRKRDGLKVGPFIGYRYSDAAEYYNEYVFGHGLGYSDFAYSKFKLLPNQTEITFTVKNIGKMKACEVAQVYVGAEDADGIMPKKELCSFARIELAPGEKRTVTLPVEIPESYDVKSKRFVCSGGKYRVYVGSSLTDIKYSCLMRSTIASSADFGDVHIGDAQTAASGGERLSDFLPSETNIITDNYKLEANCKIMRKSALNIIAGVVSLLLAILLKAYCSVSGTNAIFFDIITAILAIGGWAFFIVEFINSKKDAQINKNAISDANAEIFADADMVNITSASELFVNEFDIAAESEVEANTAAAAEVSDGIGAENYVYIDGEYTFAKAEKDFITAAAEKGCCFEEKDVRKIFASLASSRIALVKGMDANKFKKFMLVLGNYFESAVYIDSVDESYTSAESLLFKSDEHGNRSKRNMLLAIDDAKGAPHKMHFIGMDKVKLAEMSKYFTPIVQHAKNPYVNYAVTAHNEQNTESIYYLPRNLWFILNVDEADDLCGILPSLAEIVSVNGISFTDKVPPATHTSVHSFTYYQMEYLVEKVSAALDVSEETWKRIDKIEAFTDTHVKYHIGNKLWICLEKYIAVFRICGSEEKEAVDEGVAAKLLPSVVSALREVIKGSKTALIEEIESAFGEDNSSACKKVIKTCGSDNV